MGDPPNQEDSEEDTAAPEDPAEDSAEDPAEDSAAKDDRVPPAPHERLRTLAWTDFKRGATLALLGCAALAIVEFAVTIYAYPVGVRLVTALRLSVLVVALALVLWLVAAPLLGGAAVLARLFLNATSKNRGHAWPGLFAPTPSKREGPGSLAGWLWGLSLGAAFFIAGAAALIYKLTTRFKEPKLTALLAALLLLGVIAVAAGVAFLSGLGFRALGRRLHRVLGGFNPFGRVAPALALMVVIVVPAIHIALKYLPQMRELVPWRHMLALAVFAGGAYLGTVLLGRRGRLLPSEPRPRRIAVLVSTALGFAVVALALLRVGADPETKYTAITSSPTLRRLIELVRVANDFDRDGYGSLLGENDCGPFNAHVHPGARDIPDNGVDENCDGRDFTFATPPSYRTGEHLPVPKEFARNWNFLLITIDTVRYDHTGFGGYKEKSGRDTTPNLDKFVKRSTSFTFCNAPSAGTMASVPAIVTSKFFHSGIALDENVERGMPPKIKPENTLISEIMKRGHYRTGAVVTHEYFYDWGMEQGFDHFDKDLAKVRNPDRISANQVTDRAIAWIASENRNKWFLWLHYIDPHGHYVPHPGDRSFGTEQMDLYDGELYYTDKHVGRLLDELSRMPGADRTIIFITSDHGDAFKEHGFINHGQALYWELVHVPLIVYIPDLPPREVNGAVSNLDIVPTMADLAGIDISDLSLEGESLVPQLFYGRDAENRVVFSETNWPRPLRAAITSKFKLIYHLKENIYELYDLKKDPEEKHNVATRNKAAFAKMKRYLDDWLERVYYARDPETNQAAAKLKDVVLGDKPTPQHLVEGVSFDDGKIEVYGYDVGESSYRPGDKISLAVYFHAVERPSDNFKLQVEGWLAPPEGEDAKRLGTPSRSKLRFTADGIFPTGRWRAGEYVRDRFAIRVPPNWRGSDKIQLGLRMTTNNRQPVASTGPHGPGAKSVAVLGEVDYEAPAGASAPGRNPRKGALRPPPARPPRGRSSLPVERRRGLKKRPGTPAGAQ